MRFASLTASYGCLTIATMEQLKAEGFQFNSQAGAELLARTVANKDSRDEAALLTLIELGRRWPWPASRLLDFPERLDLWSNSHRWTMTAISSCGTQWTTTGDASWPGSGNTSKADPMR